MVPELQKIIDNSDKKIYVPSLYSVKKYSKLLNEELFKGQLPPINYIDIKRRRGQWACYTVTTTGQSLLCMNNRYESKNQFINVLAHELVHHWQNINNKPMNHGKTFYHWKSKFKTKGLALRLGY